MLSPSQNHESHSESECYPGSLNAHADIPHKSSYRASLHRSYDYSEAQNFFTDHAQLQRDAPWHDVNTAFLLRERYGSPPGGGNIQYTTELYHPFAAFASQTAQEQPNNDTLVRVKVTRLLTPVNLYHLTG